MHPSEHPTNHIDKSSLTGPDLFNWVIDSLEDGSLAEGNPIYSQSIAHTLGSLVGQIRNHRKMGPDMQAKVPEEIEMLKRLIAVKPNAFEVFQEGITRDNVMELLKSLGLIT